jgi:N-acetyl-anhydromuramyl-L-alanine amidase AmpD
MNIQSFPVKNFTAGRPYGIQNIVVHHMGGILTAQGCANVLNSRGVSAHYGIGSDGVVGKYVDEGNRAWHAGDGVGVGSKGNDRGIGIETSNDSGAPNWHVGDTQFNLLVELITDIAARNHLLPLKVGVNLFGHRDLRATECPGPSLYPRLQEIADKVNGGATPQPQPVPPAPTGDPIAAPEYKVVNTVLKTTANLRIRAAQTTQATQVGLLANGTKITVTKQSHGESINNNPDWFEVNGKGWVSGAYLRSL